MADLIEDIKARLDVFTLISQYLQLKKTGRSYKALSPFKNEKTPSFVVSPEKQIWHDFSTGKGGDIFTFIQEYENVDFSEALKILTEKAGLDPSLYKSSKKFISFNKNEKDELFRAHTLAMDFFHNNLFKGSDGANVLEYLRKRGVNDETIKIFKIGFARDSYDDLTNYLISKGFSKKLLLKAGLVSSKSLNAENVFDKFRFRLVFPIFDYLGRVCAFGGRSLSDHQNPKYLNSPESLIYNKSKILYGLSFAKNEIKALDSVVLVEGYFDVVLPYQEGIKNIVASSGTALTSDQVKLLSRFTKNIITAFDFDEAGFNATVRSFEIIETQKMNMLCVQEMNGKDPADFALNDPERFKKVLKNANPFFDFLIEKYSEKYTLATFESKKNIFEEIKPYLKNSSPMIKDHYIRKLSLLLGFDEQTLYDEVESFNFIKPFSSVQNLEDRSPKSLKNYSNEEVLFALILEFPVLFANIFEKIDEKCFSEDFKSVYNLLISQYNANRNLDKWDFSDIEAENLKNRLSVLALYGEERYGNFSLEILKDEVKIVLNNLIKDFQKTRLKEIQKEIANAEANNDTKSLIDLLKEQNNILSN